MNNAAMPSTSTFFDHESVDKDEIPSNRVDQDALDVHWNANQPSLPPTGSIDDMPYRLDSDLDFMSSSMAGPLFQPTVSAFFIDHSGLILAVEQQVSINSAIYMS
jgi:hypothetical protein